MNHYRILSIVFAGLFGLGFAQLGENQRRATTIIEAQKALIADPTDQESRTILASYQDRQPYPRWAVLLIYLFGTVALALTWDLSSRAQRKTFLRTQPLQRARTPRRMPVAQRNTLRR